MKMNIQYLTIGLVLLLLAVQIGCVSAADTNQTELTIFAAASLTGVVGDLDKAFETAHPGVKITPNFDSSATLETQIKEGASADLFLPASESNINNLIKAELISKDDVTPYATNKLALIVPVDNPAGITSLADLAKPGVKIVSETKDVPVRKYTEQMLNKTVNDTAYGQSFVDAFKKNIVSEETNVAGATTKVSLGEADAGITYYSDVSKELADKITIIEIPENLNVVAKYNAGVLTESKEKDLAKEYVSLLTSDDGKTALKEYKFSPV
ncbi:molybdate ABC transporter substrate-binding protein [uncultured Methanospirillum sp.]|uniref:molybdate ABC transporter substrate-binding protein n=1 Tax=uncultured Methanospirillum sp. TaxID=262503 RepID=UPI0029C96643|nr:molybdate ABC transporter substrate-binding protein [uncultured Methanospirillum sp.]